MVVSQIELGPHHWTVFFGRREYIVGCRGRLLWEFSDIAVQIKPRFKVEWI
jgi:hypothetical protein